MPKPAELTQYVLSIIYRNEQGVLDRIVGLFSGRGYILSSLSFGELNENVSRMTLVCMAAKGDKSVIRQMMQQILKIHPVERVRDLTADPHRYDAEVALLRVDCELSHHEQVKEILERYHTRGWTASAACIFCTCLNISGGGLQALITELEKFGKVAVAQSGMVSLGDRFHDLDGEVRK